MDEQEKKLTVEELLEENDRLRALNRTNEDRIAVLSALQDLARSLASELNLDPLLRNVLHSAVEVVNATAGSLLLLDSSTDELTFQVIEGGGGEALQTRRIRRDQGIAGWVATHCEPLIVEDATKDERFYPGIDRFSSFKTHSVLCVPLMLKGELIGVLQVLNKKSGQPFEEQDSDILSIFASQSAIAIKNARLFETIREERDRILMVEEDVRRRLARDLHDSLAQLLAASLMNVRFIREHVVRRGNIPQVDLAELERSMSSAMYQVRTMLFDLRPVVLETEGLVAALETYAKKLREEGTGKLHVSVAANMGRLTPKIETTVFSIVREALNNVRRHARAANIWLRMDRDDDCLHVAVEDDGQGFDVNAVQASYGERGSIGLLSMRERAEMMGGTWSIESTVGQGTKIRLSVPLYQETATLSADTLRAS